MASADQIPDAWSRIAEAYEQSFEPLTAQFAAETLRRLDLAPGARLLDVAAGTGVLALHAARSGSDVLAIDFAPGMVERLRRRAAAERLSALRAEVMDGQALDLPDASFEASASVLGIIFFPDIAKGLAEMRRVVRPGGKVAVVCWSDPRTSTPATTMMQAIRTVVPDFAPPPELPSWARLRGADSLREHLDAAGCHDVETHLVTGAVAIPAPGAFWADFTQSAPPLAHIFSRLAPEDTAAIGAVYLEMLRAESPGGEPVLRADACIGIGRA